MARIAEVGGAGFTYTETNPLDRISVLAHTYDWHIDFIRASPVAVRGFYIIKETRIYTLKE